MLQDLEVGSLYVINDSHPDNLHHVTKTFPVFPTDQSGYTPNEQMYYLKLGEPFVFLKRKVGDTYHIMQILTTTGFVGWLEWGKRVPHLEKLENIP